MKEMSVNVFNNHECCYEIQFFNEINIALFNFKIHFYVNDQFMSFYMLNLFICESIFMCNEFFKTQLNSNCFLIKN